MGLEQLVLDGRYAEALVHADAEPAQAAFVDWQLNSPAPNDKHSEAAPASLFVGLAALHAFLQANVTGPVLASASQVEQRWTALASSHGTAGGAAPSLHRACLASLDMDGVSVYQYAQHVELFCLARWAFVVCSMDDDGLGSPGPEAGTDPAWRHPSWLRLRIHTWHYKLLTEPNPGPGSVFNKMTQWSDLPSLQMLIQTCLAATDEAILDGEPADRQVQVQYLVEKTGVYAMLGMDVKAQEALDAATKLHGFVYVLTGALGKRTKFQDKSTSQLVILARSATSGSGAATAVPQALPLNNDTLLETIDFSGAAAAADEDTAKAALPATLQDMTPDKQPALSPLDQIILLSAATLKDAFSPADSLTLEEILPYATRVLQDKATNWQIYSQALIVRSRIEMHRSRTVERAVLQMQAVVDQVVVDTEAVPGGDEDKAEDKAEDTLVVPSIAISDPSGEIQPVGQPGSIFPAAAASEQAPPQERLRYINVLSTPPRWHLESELAFAWAGVGSLVSALEIFKRLRLWAEVALCLASNGALEDGTGRGTGGEEKARALIRWQLFAATDASREPAGGADGKTVDILSLRAADFYGPERTPAPANAARLLCILGDIEAEPKHYERAWTVSKQRYARAQRSLGEHYLQQRDWERAREAYKKAVGANRLNPQLWSRLGDIQLRLGAFADAAEAFSRSIAGASDAVGGEDARTWSNLGSALYSMYTEVMEKGKEEEEEEEEEGKDVDEEKENEEDDNEEKDDHQPDPALLLSQSLAAYKRGASIAHDNWRIWDNVVTLASRARPPVIGDILVAVDNILMIRATEEAVDVDVVRLLLQEAVLGKPSPTSGTPTRGTQEKAVCELIESRIVPLITTRSELWELVVRERVWRGDLAGAIEAAEKGWRTATGGSGGGGSGSLGAASAAKAASGSADSWLEKAEAWEVVVARTDELVAVLEKYGSSVPSVGSRWKLKARSALRSVMSRGRDAWEGSVGWTTLEQRLAEVP